MRSTFAELGDEMRIDENNILHVRGKEVGLVYFRTGYTINQYDTGTLSSDGWKVRTQLETSMAIKCPSIDVQLCTFKKYQQAFSSRELLQQVTRDEIATDKLIGLF
jgi:glutathione synthase